MEYACDCGSVDNHCTIYNLLSGHTYSCGCKNIENLNNRNLKHGDSVRGKRSRLYVIWLGMVKRCRPGNSNSCANYYQAGIRVCEEWLDYKNFKEWALKNGYEKELTIDRIDVYGNYEPNNCRWVGSKEQSMNKKNTLYVTYKGKEYKLKELCEQEGFSYSQLKTRIYRGWDPDKLFEKLDKKISYKGFRGNLKEICSHANVSYSMVKNRIRRGMSLEKAIETPKRTSN